MSKTGSKNNEMPINLKLLMFTISISDKQSYEPALKPLY
jgi:hypothetical protein